MLISPLSGTSSELASLSMFIEQLRIHGTVPLWTGRLLGGWTIFPFLVSCLEVTGVW